MTRPIYEPSTQRQLAYQGWGQHQLFRRPAPVTPPCAVLFIKVFGDAQAVAAGDGKFVFEVSHDMDEMILTEIESYITTVSSSGAVTIMLRNRTTTADMLSTACTIDQGDLNSKDAGTQPVINTFNYQVAWGDHLEIDVDSAGSGAMGLGVIITFCGQATVEPGPPAIQSIQLSTTLAVENTQSYVDRRGRKGTIKKIRP